MRVPARPRLRRNRGRDGPRGRPRNFLKCVRSRTTPARSASPPHAPCLRVTFAPSCCAAGTRPRLRVAARLGTNFGRSAACGPLGRHRRRQGGSRLVPAAILVDSCRHPSITRRCGKGAAWTPFGPCRPIVRRVPATILPVHRAVDCTRLPESAIIFMPVQAGAHSAEGDRAPPPHAACWNTRRFLCSL